MSKLDEAIKWSTRNQGGPKPKSVYKAPSGDAWEGSHEVECPECTRQIDLKNPAIQRDGECACGFRIVDYYNKNMEHG